MRMQIREFNAKLIAPILRLTGFRFDKSYRHADIQATGKISFKGIVYALVSTPLANVTADM